MFLNQLILTFFYSGKTKKAPGTIGSLATLLLWLYGCLAFYYFSYSVMTIVTIFIVLSAILTLYGTLAIPSYLQYFKYKNDHSSIVLDEVIGQLLALSLSFPWFVKYYFNGEIMVTVHIFAAFALFRLFDIVKPSLIGMIDKKVKGGFGVILDDIAAGIAAAGVMIVANIAVSSFLQI